MRDLRLVGVHEDGEHLLLSGPDGEQYLLEVDEPLRAAVRRDRARLGQLQIEMSGQVRPRDIQAQIRAGSSAEEVAARTGWPLEKIRRYEGAVLAEREHMSDLGQAVQLRRRGGDAGVPTLAQRVRQRLTARGGEPGAWDSWRTEGGPWTLTYAFTANGREREARWTFDVTSRTVLAQDDEARWLSEDEQPTPGPLPTPHLTAVPTALAAVSPVSPVDRVYDLDAEGGLRGSDDPASIDLGAGPPAAEAVAALPSRRQTRRRPPPPVELGHGLPRHRGGRHGELSDEYDRPRPDEAEPLLLEPVTFDPSLLGDPPPAHPFPGRLREESKDAATVAPPSGDIRPAIDVRSGREVPGPRRARRASVPSWDEIMFGGKRD
jgi:hypothetical protein